MARRKSCRRGILLLIVLSLLVLFVLIGVTFIVVASNYKTHAKAISRHEQHGDDPSKELNSALYSLLRGTPSPDLSELGYPTDLTYRHSLLGDLYGRPGFTATVASVSFEPQSRPENLGLLRIDFDATAVAGRWFDSEGYYSGSVLTMIDGPARGQSTRVVGYRRRDADPAVQNVYSLLLESFTQPFSPKNPAELKNLLEAKKFLVNDPPFNGTGDGYYTYSADDTNDGRKGTPGALDAKVPYPLDDLSLDAPDPDSVLELALLPDYWNFSRKRLPAWNYRVITPVGNSVQWGEDAAGGWDESWDAVDYQNFFLARIPTNNKDLIPSFHRPQLIRHWMARLNDANNPLASASVTWDGDPEFRANHLRRYISARPLPQPDEHPFFTGSNPAMTVVWIPNPNAPPGSLMLRNDPLLPQDLDGDGTPNVYDLEVDPDDYVPLVDGPWDVDNDGDGIPDSVWVDLGAPIKVAADGRRYKPLFAVLCVDLDGRLNLNAHGPNPALPSMPLPRNGAGGVSTKELSVTRGQGYGPAEIRSDEILTFPDFRSLAESRYQGYVPNDLGPGLPGQLDALASLKTWGERMNPRSQVDFFGAGAVYLDQFGYPLTVTPGLNSYDDPYETNLVEPQASDQVYGIEELEKLLRAYDADSVTLTSRITGLTSGLTSFSELDELRRYTTHSFDIPVVSSVPSDEDWRKNYGVDATPAKILRGLLDNAFPVASTDDEKLSRERLLDEQIKLMIPYEVRMGRRMDVNRPLEGVVQDDTSWYWSWPAENASLNRFKCEAAFAMGDPHYLVASNQTNPYFSRQVYARHLYCMMMLLAKSTGFELPTDTEQNQSGVNPDRRILARRIAQWAVNVVDFRDTDSVMTPFEFDLDPFDEDGWNVDDNFQTGTTANGGSDGSDRAVVWGSEYPELLFTESLAFHDRRVRDTKSEGGDDAAKRRPKDSEHDNTDDNPDNNIEPDEDLDQFRIPEGSLYLELYCTGNPNVIGTSNSELYTNGALELDRVVPDPNGFSPVWRIAIVEPPELVTSDDPDDDPALADNDQASVDRWALTRPALDQYLGFRPDDLSMLPRDPTRLTVSDLPTVAPECYVYFTRDLPAAEKEQGAFYNQSNWSTAANNRAVVQPGTVLVLGPRPITILGSKVREQLQTPIGDTEVSAESLQTQSITLRPDGLEFVHLGDNRTYPRTPTGTRGFVIAADPPRPIDANDDDWWTQPNTPNESPRRLVGLNVSEPLSGANYYRAPDFKNTNPLRQDSYPDGELPDTPLDDRPGRPLAQRGLNEGVLPQFRVALLQRLANPSLPYNAETNPYLTIDAHAIDLTVFNGEDFNGEEDRKPADWVNTDQKFADDQDPQPEKENGYFDPVPGSPPPPTADQIPPVKVDVEAWHFGPRQRGSLSRFPVSQQEMGRWQRRARLWGDPIPMPPGFAGFLPPPPWPSGYSVLIPELWNGFSTSSIGIERLADQNKQLREKYKIDHYFPFQPGGTLPGTTQSFETLGTHNQWYDRSFVGQWKGVKPYAWLTWKNADFTSPLEMMLVPASSPWRLAYEFNFQRGASNNPYEDFRSPFGHLLNFFQCARRANGDSPDLARIFDFLEVRSPFVGTETWLTTEFQAVAPPPIRNPSDAFDPSRSPFESEVADLHTPFNRVLEFRDPGRININTISDPAIWNAIDPKGDQLSGVSHQMTSWANVQKSMIGSTNPLNRPAYYSNPFRSAASAQLMPLDSLEKSPSEVTLLRPDPNVDRRPLFFFEEDNDDFATGAQPYNNPEGNAYFRYHKIQRLNNLLTTHSNVYAIWITVGYFELLPWTPRKPDGTVDPSIAFAPKDAIQAAGFELGPELGSDTGQIRRHRAFYVVDRSIPVAFEPGENHNVDKAILLRRMIE